MCASYLKSFDIVPSSGVDKGTPSFVIDTRCGVNIDVIVVLIHMVDMTCSFRLTHVSHISTQKVTRSHDVFTDQEVVSLFVVNVTSFTWGENNQMFLMFSDSMVISSEFVHYG